jgi:hypothetical protein
VPVLVVLLLNGPFWYRNVATYGGPYGARLPALDEEQALLELPRTSIVETAEFLLGRWVRMLAMHFVTPVHGLNAAIFAAMRRAPALFPEGYVTSLELAAWNHEMTAGNPLHVVLIASALVTLLLTRRLRFPDPVVLLALAAVSGIFFVSFAGCSNSIFCMRFQLSFFYLAAPVVAVVLYRVAPRAVTVAAFLILAYAVPYVLFNNMRPVVGIPPWPTRIKSVFLEDPDKILFAQSPEIRDEYEFVAARVLEADCGQVGLVTSRDSLEYALWRLLGAPESGVRIEHLRASPDTQKYIDPGFSPCAVICTACGGLPPGFDMPLISDFGHIRLYLRRAD